MKWVSRAVRDTIYWLTIGRGWGKEVKKCSLSTVLSATFDWRGSDTEYHRSQKKDRLELVSIFLYISVHLKFLTDDMLANEAMQMMRC